MDKVTARMLGLKARSAISQVDRKILSHNASVIARKYLEDYLKSVSEMQHVNHNHHHNHRPRIAMTILGGYFPFKEELDCLQVLEDIRKDYASQDRLILALPKITDHKNKHMEFRTFPNLASVELGKWNLTEPDPKLTDKVVPHICLIPMTSFDDNLNRVGLGGGFYDRFLRQHPNTHAVGIAFDVQKAVGDIQMEKTDVPLNAVITDKRLYLPKVELKVDNLTKKIANASR